MLWTGRDARTGHELAIYAVIGREKKTIRVKTICVCPHFEKVDLPQHLNGYKLLTLQVLNNIIWA